MFEKLVAIEPVSLIPSAEEELHRYAKEVVLYRDVPGSDDEMVRRIGDADAVLLSYTSRMGKEVIAQCPNIRYIGMCCSLYSEESANVDIAYARTRGIQVLGIRDYGDRGVVQLLPGFGNLGDTRFFQEVLAVPEHVRVRIDGNAVIAAVYGELVDGSFVKLVAAHPVDQVV